MLGDLGDERHVLARRQARDQVVELEHEADVLAAIAGQLALVGADQVVVAEDDLAGGRRVEPAEDVEQRRLAAAGRAEQHDKFAFANVEIDRAQRMHLDFARPINLRQPARDKHRVIG